MRRRQRPSGFEHASAQVEGIGRAGLGFDRRSRRRARRTRRRDRSHSSPRCAAGRREVDAIDDPPVRRRRTGDEAVVPRRRAGCDEPSGRQAIGVPLVHRGRRRARRAERVRNHGCQPSSAGIERVTGGDGQVHVQRRRRQRHVLAGVAPERPAVAERARHAPRASGRRRRRSVATARSNTVPWAACEPPGSAASWCSTPSWSKRRPARARPMAPSGTSPTASGGRRAMRSTRSSVPPTVSAAIAPAHRGVDRGRRRSRPAARSPREHAAMRAVVQRVSGASVDRRRRGRRSDRARAVRAASASPTTTTRRRPPRWPTSCGTCGCSTTRPA